MRNFATALRSVLTVSLSLLWAAMACSAARAEGLDTARRAQRK